MNLNEIVRLFDFDAWATDRMFSAVEKLTPEQYARDMESSFGGIRGTLAHIHFANWIWMERWKGNSPTAPPVSEAELDTFSTLKERWLGLRSEVRRFIEDLTEDKLQSPYPYKTMDGSPNAQVLADQMQHVVNHSSYHRGQVITMLRQLGASGIGTDFISYIRVISE